METPAENTTQDAPVCSDPRLLVWQRITLERRASGWMAFETSAPSIVGFGATARTALYALEQSFDESLTTRPECGKMDTSQECGAGQDCNPL